jgi:hypothetical protein
VAKRLIEVFIAGCSVCEDALKQVGYKLNKKFDTLECNGQVFRKSAGMIKKYGSEWKMEDHFYSRSVNNKLTISNGRGGNVHVQVI